MLTAHSPAASSPSACLKAAPRPHPLAVAPWSARSVRSSRARWRRRMGMRVAVHATGAAQRGEWRAQLARAPARPTVAAGGGRTAPPVLSGGVGWGWGDRLQTARNVLASTVTRRRRRGGAARSGEMGTLRAARTRFSRRHAFPLPSAAHDAPVAAHKVLPRGAALPQQWMVGAIAERERRATCLSRAIKPHRRRHAWFGRAALPKHRHTHTRTHARTL
jgi:hypothetical protein